MKKLLILALILAGGVAGADSTITSKQYVDAALDTLQSEISAKNTDTVLTHTGTAGEIGEKKIYNAGNSYGEQTDALVTAGAFNSAVQNALESEFVCTEWQGDVHDNAHCLLYEVRGVFQKSKNLFDISQISNRNVSGPYKIVINNGDGSITITSHPNDPSVPLGKTLRQLAPDLVVGKTYRLSFNGGHSTVSLYNSKEGTDHWFKSKPLTIEQRHLDAQVYFYPSNVANATATISNIQIEEGTVVTPYVPYGNIYMPSEN